MRKIPFEAAFAGVAQKFTREGRGRSYVAKVLADIDTGKQTANVELLQSLVDKLSGSDDTELIERVLSIAEHTKIKDALPTETYLKKEPLPPLSIEKLNLLRRELNQEQFTEAFSAFIDHMRKGYFSVFVHRHNDSINHARTLSASNMDVFNDEDKNRVREVNGGPNAREGPYFSDQLVPGYRAAKKVFNPKTFSTMMMHWASNLTNGNFPGVNIQRDHDEKNALYRRAEGNQKNFSVSVEVMNTYLPTISESKMATAGEVGINKRGGLVNAKEQKVSPKKCIKLTILAKNDNRITSDTRCATLTVFIYLGSSKKLGTDQHFEPYRMDSYSGILRAIHTNPNMVIEALRQLDPNIFIGRHGDKNSSYFPETTDTSLAEINLKVPEFTQAKIPTDNVPFKTLNTKVVK